MNVLKILPLTDHLKKRIFLSLVLLPELHGAQPGQAMPLRAAGANGQVEHVCGCNTLDFAIFIIISSCKILKLKSY